MACRLHARCRVEANHELTVVALVFLCMIGMAFALESPDASRARTLAWMVTFVIVSLVGIVASSPFVR